MSRESVAGKISAKIYFKELAASRALGCDGITARVSALRAMDQTYARAFEPERPAVWQRPRTVTGRR